MTTEMWTNAMTGLSQYYGLTTDGMLLLVSILISLGITIAVVRTTREKNLALPTFFITWCIMVFLFGWTWLIFVVPLLLVGAYIWSKGEHT